MSKISPQVANRRIESFSKRFTKAHLYLAYHAAFPLALTPNLLYRIWANFQRDIHAEVLDIPWIAVADLLLSSLCDEVGHELYEMDLSIRNLLLKRLQEDEKFGQQRIHELSNFLVDYVQQQLQSDDPDVRDFAQAQYWTAIAYTKPSEAARELTATLKKAYQTDRADLIRLASLVETLAEPLAEFEPLLVDARKMRSFASSNQEILEPLLPKNRFSKSLIFSGVALALVNVSFWYLYEPAKAIPMCMQSFMDPQGNDKALGIGVYDQDGRVDWTAVKNSGKTFAFLKATEGVSIKDSAFDHHWRTLKAVGMIRGASHFFHPKSDAVLQAKEFLKTVGKFEPGDLPPVLDIEITDKVNSQAVINAAKQWLAVVEKALKQQTGKTIKPIIYTYSSFWQELGNPSDFASYPLWIAHYGTRQPTIPSPWQGKYLFHEYEGDISGVTGVSGRADLESFNGSVQDLNCFVKSPSLFQVTSQLRNLISGQKVTKNPEPSVSPTSTQIK
ncbi:glycoside hydrolase family 25 protein [Nostoc sp. PA-18-2419]|uniref:glycoside hydrolase family 25 protein n=1 Tax=Nostoc sp. PA-18-2419 TaxID=2575443 RepID=UPI001CB8C748|nr:glycoside hydrolase family 25 protein [Nostoc sp. PA-18-2419]